MNKTITILLILLLFPAGASAYDNVSLEIFLNANNEYYVGVDGGSLQPCLTGMCNITIDRNITTNTNISDKDMRKIALQTATELNSLTFVTDSLNATETRLLIENGVDKGLAAQQTFFMTTFMPQTKDFQNLTIELEQSKGEVTALQNAANGYTTTIAAKETEIELLRRKADEYGFIMLVFLFGLAWFGLPQTAVFQQWKDKMRMQ